MKTKRGLSKQHGGKKRTAWKMPYPQLWASAIQLCRSEEKMCPKVLELALRDLHWGPVQAHPHVGHSTEPIKKIWVFSSTRGTNFFQETSSA